MWKNLLQYVKTYQNIKVIITYISCFNDLMKVNIQLFISDIWDALHFMVHSNCVDMKNEAFQTRSKKKSLKHIFVILYNNCLIVSVEGIQKTQE